MHNHPLMASFVAALTVAVGASPAAAAAPALQPGDSFTYETTSQMKLSGNVPAQAAGRPQPAYRATTTIAVKSVNPDGSAVVHVVVQKDPPDGTHFGAAQMAVWNQMNAGSEFDTTMMPWRALRINVDIEAFNGPALSGSATQQAFAILALGKDPSHRRAVAANQAKGYLSTVDAVAEACAKRASFAAGDTWHAIIDGLPYDFAVTGRQTEGTRDVVVLSVAYDSVNPGGETKLNGTALYDPKAQLVVGTHTVSIASIKANGMTNTTTSDTTLKE
jgi:hypothetical protein